MRLTFESMDSIAVPGVGSPDPIEELSKTGRLRKRDLCFLDIRFFCRGTGTYAIGSPGFQALDSDWDCNTGFCGSPTCQMQIFGLLSLNHRLSRFLRIYLWI